MATKPTPKGTKTSTTTKNLQVRKEKAGKVKGGQFNSQVRGGPVMGQEDL
jgi:hypothetical protein